MIQIVFAFFLTNAFSESAKEVLHFSTKKIVIGGQSLIVEMAITDAEQSQGLMYRKKLDENRGMLFVYSNEQTLSFWMKNTFIPLSIGFFNKNRVLVDIQDMSPVTSIMQTRIPSYQSKVRAQYALEVPRGWFQRNRIKINDQFNFVETSPK